MDKELLACCKDLPELSQQEISSNLGDLTTLYSRKNRSPSLYEELFDVKRFNELIEDPLLNTGAMECGKNGNDTAQNITQNITNQATAPRQPNGNLDSSQVQNVSGAMNGNYYPNNGFGGTLLDISQPGTSGYVQNQMSASPYVAPAWQGATSTTASSIASTRPLASSNSGPPPRINAQRSFVHVKTEPQERADSPPDHDQDDYNDYSTESHPSSAISRGALYAREYRRKTKNRVGQLEQENERLRRENKALKEAYHDASAKATGLSREVIYLRQVLANDSTIATLLNSVVSNAPGLKFQCPLVSTDKTGNTTAVGSKRTLADGKGNGNGSKQRKMNENEVQKVKEGIQKSGDSPGVCLHVNGDMVSVEFCPRCNRDARRGCGDLQ